MKRVSFSLVFFLFTSQRATELRVFAERMDYLWKRRPQVGRNPESARLAPSLPKMDVPQMRMPARILKKSHSMSSLRQSFLCAQARQGTGKTLSFSWSGVHVCVSVCWITKISKINLDGFNPYICVRSSLSTYSWNTEHQDKFDFETNKVSNISDFWFLNVTRCDIH